MPRVVAADLALTKTGIGVITQRANGSTLASGGLLKHERPLGKAKRARAGLPSSPTIPERHACLKGAGTDVLHHARRADLVVIYQGYTGAVGQGDARQDVLALWWYVVGPLVRAGTPVAVLHDSTARKALTGKGTHGDRAANKVATALAVRGLYPDLELETDDVADAVGAAHLGAVALGWDVPTLARHRDTKWSEWPTFPDPASGSEDAA